MGWRRKLWHGFLGIEFNGCHTYPVRLYATKVDLKKLRPMILKRIEKRAKDYPVRPLVPVAKEVLETRRFLNLGVSTLLKKFPVMACRFCPEVFVGEEGHLIRNCRGYKRRGKNGTHEWIPGGLNDILVPVEAFHLNSMFQGVIKHDQRFDFDRVPAVVELCWQAGVGADQENVSSINWKMEANDIVLNSLSPEEIILLANETLRAWESLRSGVQKLLSVYPAKVCKHCSEVHIGPSGHKARLCGVFKYETWRGAHFWKKAEVDDLVPPKIVWKRRSQDPLVLVDEMKDYYGHAPVVVDLCSHAGAVVPGKYHCMMKVQGLSAPPLSQ